MYHTYVEAHPKLDNFLAHMMQLISEIYSADNRANLIISIGVILIIYGSSSARFDLEVRGFGFHALVLFGSYWRIHILC